MVGWTGGLEDDEMKVTVKYNIPMNHPFKRVEIVQCFYKEMGGRR